VVAIPVLITFSNYISTIYSFDFSVILPVPIKRSSAVVIATGYGLDDQGVGV
jgi:hypothetical protein